MLGVGRCKSWKTNLINTIIFQKEAQFSPFGTKTTHCGISAARAEA